MEMSERTIASSLLDIGIGIFSSPDAEATTSSSSLSAIGISSSGGISTTDGIDGALCAVRFEALVESPTSEAGVLDTAEMLTSEARVPDAFVTSARCRFLADFSSVSTSHTTSIQFGNNHSSNIRHFTCNIPLP